MFEASIIATINEPTRVTKHRATAIANKLHFDFKSAIVKTDLSDHFPIIFINEFKRDHNPKDDMEKCVYERDFNENTFNCFKQAFLKHHGIVLKI